MISVRALATRAGTFRLGPVSLTIRRGEVLVLLGPSGAGKTLLLETMMGLRQADAGQVVIAGRDVTRLPPEQRDLAYLPQDVALFPHLSVRDNVLFGRRVRGTLAGAEAELVRLADLVQIRHLLGRATIGSLSGGERQRVALARALITNPNVVFLDESFSGLDAHIRQELLSQLRELQRSLELTVVYVTHNQREASAIGDSVAVLMEGSVVQEAAPETLFRHPADLRVARFIQLSNILELDSTHGPECSVSGVPLTLPSAPPEGRRLWLGVAAEDVVLLRPGEAEGIGVVANVLRGRVLGIDGRHAQIDVVDGEGLTISCELSARDRVYMGTGLRAGEEVAIHLPPQALSVFPERAP
ncbi:MAG: ABC transporter ATP-binding protein [Myxococcales bacterium]|nr:ABC transporter ATP-binding protein [Myxococcales bacterium]